MSLSQIEVMSVAKRAELKKVGHLKLASPQTLFDLFAVCGPKKLQAILDKHISTEHKGKSGIPDLLLYATSHATGLPVIARL